MHAHLIQLLDAHSPKLTSMYSTVDCFEINLARRQNIKLAWEDAWNHGRYNLSVK